MDSFVWTKRGPNGLKCFPRPYRSEIMCETRNGIQTSVTQRAMAIKSEAERSVPVL